MRTAESNPTAAAFGAGRGRFTLVASMVLVGALVGCRGDAPGYGIGEGAPDIVGYERAYMESGGAEEIGMPASAVERWSVGCRQLFAGGRSKTAVLLQQPCGENRQVFAVTGAFWDLFRNAGEDAKFDYGFPVGRRAAWKHGWTQGFGHSGGLSAFFMQRSGGPAHVLSSPMLEYYLSFDDRDGRFGYPTAGQSTLTGGRRCQEFEQATITATKDGGHYAFSVLSAHGDGRAPRCQHL